MEFPLSTNSAQAPDDDFILFNNLIASGTANMDEIEDADFSGLPPDASVLSFPTRHSNARQSSLMNGNGEIIGRESHAILFFSPDDDFSLFNKLIASGTANMDEIETAHFSGLPPESSFPSFPTRLANARQSSLMNGEIIGRKSQVWNPCTTPPPPSVCPSAVTTQVPSWDSVAPESSTIPATEDNLQQSFISDLGTSHHVFNPNLYQSPFHVGDSNKQSNEIVGGVSQDQYWVGQSERIDYPTDEPSSEVVDLLNSTVLTSTMEDLIMSSSWQTIASTVAEEVDCGKKRQKPDDGRRRCCCRKNKCVQRYCVCFYSGFSCDDACGCEECRNTIEQRALVLKKREEMKSKNPHAFAPKIEPLDQENSELPGIQLSGQKMKHRRGCGCTKSKCAQNYCECYKAHVKCSVACRCKGCENKVTQEQDAGPADFMIGNPTNHHVNAHRFHSHGGEMLAGRKVTSISRP